MATTWRYLLLLLTQKYWWYVLQTSIISKETARKWRISRFFGKKFENSVYFQRKYLKANFCDSNVIKMSLWREMKGYWNTLWYKSKEVAAVPICQYQNHTNRRLYSENLGRGGNHPLSRRDTFGRRGLKVSRYQNHFPDFHTMWHSQYTLPYLKMWER